MWDDGGACSKPFGQRRPRARVVLFDFDGTLSLIRTGWMQAMVPMRIEVLAETGTSESEEQLRGGVAVGAATEEPEGRGWTRGSAHG